MRKQSESRLYCKTIIYYPSSFTNSCKWLLLKLPTNLLCNGLHVVLPYMQGISNNGLVESWSNLKAATNQSRLQAIENCEQSVHATESSEKGWPGYNLAQCAKSIAPTAVLYTMGKLNNHLKLGLQNTRGLFLCLTTTLDKISCHVHMKTTTKWILEMSEFLY